MSSLVALRSAKNIHDLAKIIGYKPKTLSYILYKLQNNKKYHQFQIPKKSGGYRTINAPLDKLKKLQESLTNLLTNCINELNSDQKYAPFSHAFIKDRSIATNAKLHKNKRWVLNFDIHDFFGSINYGRVRGILIKDRNFLLDPKVATLIAQIACHMNVLPQGSPASPILSNIVTRPLDLRFIRLAKKHGFTYSRYADDITLSSNKKNLQPKLASISENEKWTLSSDISNLLARSGFRINHQKTRLQYNKNRQTVTGLVVNKRINVPREYRKTIRSMVHKLVTTGSFSIPQDFNAESNNNKNIETRITQLQGMLGYIDWVDMFSESLSSNCPFDEIRKEKRNKAFELKDLNPQEKTYRKFLLYSKFFAIQKPVIITEGKTDIDHLKIAINQLYNFFPDLIEKIDNKKEIKFNVLPSTQRRTTALLGITGGTANLNKFVAFYKNETKNFILPPQSQPVIILVDNDSGLKSLKKETQEHLNNNPLKPIYKNLYIASIPLADGKIAAAIEDLYEKSVLETTINNKKFNSGNKDRDKDKYYSKNIFVQKVIKENYQDINFDGFKPLFEKIISIINEHRKSFH